jgi:hypothetical protein
MPTKHAQKTPSKLNPKWIKQTSDYFLKFLKVTKFPHPVRDGKRGSEFDYPEWLIMFIAIMAVKCKLKTYLGIHRMTVEYWRVIRKEHETEIQAHPISERQLRDRLKKICYSHRKPPVFIFQIFPARYFE